MDALQIILSNGDATSADKLRAYFSGVFQAEESGEEFAVDLAHVWRIGYPRKDHAVRALRRDFVEGVDFQVSLNIGENYTTGRPEESYRLTVSCMEYFAVRANREVFEVYRGCRKAVRNVLRGALPDFSNPATAARAWAAEYEAKQLAEAANAAAQQQLIEAAPKVEFFDAVSAATDCVPLGDVAKVLGWGRNLLFARLRADHILMNGNVPYQDYINRGWFEVKQRTIKRTSGPMLRPQTMATGKGIAALSARYQR